MKQTVAALSSAGAEYVAMFNACTMDIYLHHLLGIINKTQKETCYSAVISDKLVEVGKIGTDFQKTDIHAGKDLGRGEVSQEPPLLACRRVATAPLS